MQTRTSIHPIRVRTSGWNSRIMHNSHLSRDWHLIEIRNGYDDNDDDDENNNNNANWRRRTTLRHRSDNNINVDA